MYIRVYRSVYECINAYIYMYRLYMYIFLIYIQIYLYMYICRYMYMCMCIYIYTYIYVHSRMLVSSKLLLVFVHTYIKMFCRCICPSFFKESAMKGLGMGLRLMEPGFPRMGKAALPRR